MGNTAGRQPTLKELEASLEQHFNLMVRLMGGMTIKLAPIQKGVPDRLVFLPKGRMVLVELKAWNGDLSEMQKHVHGRLKTLGQTVVVLTGRDEVDAWARQGGGVFANEGSTRPSPRRKSYKGVRLEDELKELGEQ